MQSIIHSNAMILHYLLYVYCSVWQENRDRIVGFPGRGVVWNNSRWEYDYDSTPCDTSMVLTGNKLLKQIYTSIEVFHRNGYV